MNSFLQSAETFFNNAEAWGANLPLYISVPLIMILAAIGTAGIVGLLLGLVRLIFGKKATDFIKNIPQRLNNAAAK